MTNQQQSTDPTVSSFIAEQILGEAAISEWCEGAVVPWLSVVDLSSGGGDVGLLLFLTGGRQLSIVLDDGFIGFYKLTIFGSAIEAETLGRVPIDQVRETAHEAWATNTMGAF